MVQHSSTLEQTSSSCLYLVHVQPISVVEMGFYLLMGICKEINFGKALSPFVLNLNLNVDLSAQNMASAQMPHVHY